ncbi:hypothetical protein, partial [Aliarcobacter cryaerophilus]|uniref:hypothetical protein n=1 Tax=Aliarcobacter cryaerophilus TaxID=28198 RepID=UPI0011E0690D
MSINPILNKKILLNLNAIKLEQGYNVYFKVGFYKAKDTEYQISNVYANDIYMTSGNDINLQAVNINAKNEKIAYAQNSLNILAKTY